MSQDDIRERFDVNRRNLVKSLGVGGIAGLAGCAGGGGSDTPTEGESDTPTPEDSTPTPADSSNVQMGGELIASFGADVANFDPTRANDTTSSKAFGLVYEPLMATDFSGAPQPVLATSVEQKEGDLEWRANLREGVMFHNGNELTAEDVKATFERYEGTPREADVYDWYDSSTVVDDYTLDFTLQAKYAPLKFALGGVPIVPKEVADGDIALKDDPVGTGPYVFDEHQPDTLFRLQRNEDYWFTGSDSMPEKPPIETITFRIIVEQSAQLAALQSGDIDLMNNVPAASYQDLKDNDEFTVTERTQGGFDLLAFPMAVTPYDNAKVRRGVSRLIPRDAIVESVYQGIGTPATSPISPLAGQFTSPEFNQRMGDEYLGYDPEKAATLLEEGFNEAGVEAPFQTKIITNENPQRVKWAQLIQESLNSTDYFEVELEQFEWNTYVGIILGEESDQNNNLIAVGWSAGWDADAYVHNLFHSETFTPACCNIPHYKSEEVDNLIDQGLQTYDLDERKEIYQQLMEKVCQDAPITYIRFGKAMDAFRTDAVKGFQTYPIDSGEYTGIYSPSANAFTYVDK
ncbi:ABC transporter substrate-binding protein [Halobaculum limi]|uniref:ABC transporter substrate-binding protein n=1 Tax=Halobaculum limi TaxID=3031916 RepID=UPI00240510CC|nr:ABC transporter substrate-binding protein [Halobaculum sp. YSMS11]